MKTMGLINLPTSTDSDITSHIHVTRPKSDEMLFFAAVFLHRSRPNRLEIDLPRRLRLELDVPLYL